MYPSSGKPPALASLAEMVPSDALLDVRSVCGAGLGVRHTRRAMNVALGGCGRLCAAASRSRAPPSDEVRRTSAAAAPELEAQGTGCKRSVRTSRDYAPALALAWCTANAEAMSSRLDVLRPLKRQWRELWMSAYSASRVSPSRNITASWHCRRRDSNAATKGATAAAYRSSAVVKARDTANR